MKLIISFFIFIFSLSAFGAFTGTFQGKGIAKFKSGRSYECEEIFLRMDVSTEFFKLREGGYNCSGFLNAQFDAFKMMILNGQLLNNNEVLGQITDKELSYQIFDPEDGSTYRLELSMINHELHYREEWHDGKEIALVVLGTLQRH